MGLSYFRYSWAQWYPLEIEIHPYSYVQSRLHFNLESPRLHSTPPFSTCLQLSQVFTILDHWSNSPDRHTVLLIISTPISPSPYSVLLGDPTMKQQLQIYDNLLVWLDSARDRTQDLPKKNLRLRGQNMNSFIYM